MTRADLNIVDGRINLGKKAFLAEENDIIEIPVQIIQLPLPGNIQENENAKIIERYNEANGMALRQWNFQNYLESEIDESQ